MWMQRRGSFNTMDTKRQNQQEVMEMDHTWSHRVNCRRRHWLFLSNLIQSNYLLDDDNGERELEMRRSFTGRSLALYEPPFLLVLDFYSVFFGFLFVGQQWWRWHGLAKAQFFHESATLLMHQTSHGHYWYILRHGMCYCINLICDCAAFTHSCVSYAMIWQSDLVCILQIQLIVTP